MTQSSTPLWTALGAYANKRVVPFHTPGHKLRAGPFKEIADILGEGFFNLDPSDEIEDRGLGHRFEAVLKRAESLAAELFGALDTLFLVNGTTSGLHYLLMPTTERILIPRFSHQAVYSALVLSGAEPVYIPARYERDWMIPLALTVSDILECMETGCQALVVTHPTYYGTVSELAELTRVAHGLGLLVFVDEAHGGHFQFSQALPPSGLQCGADAVVQSTHKTLGSFTQTSMLHSADPDWFAKVVQAKQVLETTSPSLVFLAVLDAVRAILAQQGRKLVQNSLELAWDLAERLEKIKGVGLPPRDLRSDPTKIVFSLRGLGLTGVEVEHILRRDYNIQVELSDYYSVLALISLGDAPESVEVLLKAVADLAERKAHLGGPPLPRPSLDAPSLPPVCTTMRSAFFSHKEVVPLKTVLGRASGGFITPYPPGVPIIVPGELFTAEIVDYLNWCIGLGWPVRGILAGEKVLVLKDNGASCRKTD